MCNSVAHDVPASPQKYRVAIIETLRRTIEVEDNDPDQTEQIASDGWHRSKYVLGAKPITNL